MNKIFIIDDEESVVRLLIEYFNRLNFKCEGYFFDRDIITSIREFMPDIIICDMNLHTTSGLEVLSELKQNIDLASIAFIFLTGSINEQAIKKGFELGADDCLRKPLDLSEIKKQVVHVLNRRRSHVFNRLNILLIDQNDKRSVKLYKLLEERGNFVLKARKLSAAKKLIKNNTIDVIISGSNFIDGDVLNFYEKMKENLQSKYFTLILDSNETEAIRKARDLGINDFIYTNYGENYFRGKLLQIINENNAVRFRYVFSLKEKNPENILKSCKKNAFTGNISIISNEGNGIISMDKGKYVKVTFNDENESNAINVINSLTDGEMIINQRKIKIN